MQHKPLLDLSLIKSAPWIYRRSPDPHSLYVAARITAPAVSPAQVEDARKNAPLHITCCLDVSGSTAGEILRNEKLGIEFLLTQLRPQDRFGLVVFGHSERIVCPLIAMSDENKRKIRQALTELSASGNTNLSGGLFAALRMAYSDDATNNNDVFPSTGNATFWQQRNFSNNSNNNNAFGGCGSITSLSRTATVVTAPTQVFDATSSAQIQHTMNRARLRTGSNVSYEYRVTVTPPTACDFYTVSALPTDDDTGASNAAVVAAQPNGPTKCSGIVELTFPAVLAPLRALEIIFHFGSAAPEHRVEYSLGEVSQKKQTVRVQPAGPLNPAGAAPAAAAAATSAASAATTNAAATRAVILLSDGKQNAGITNPGQILAGVREILARQAALSKNNSNNGNNNGSSQVKITAVGFGADANATLLRDIAEATGGQFYHLAAVAGAADRIPRLFADVLGSMLSTVATNIKLQLRPALGVQLVEVLTKFKVSTGNDTTAVAPTPTPASVLPSSQAHLLAAAATSGFWGAAAATAATSGNNNNNNGAVTVEINDLLAEEQREVVFHLMVPPSVVPVLGDTFVHSVASLNYKPVGAFATSTAAAATTEQMGTINVRDEFCPYPINLDVAVALQRHRCCVVLDQVRDLADRGQLADAHQRARALTEELRAAHTARPNPVLRACLAQAESVAAQTETQSLWTMHGQHNTNRFASELGWQRNNNDNAHDITSAYRANACRMHFQSLV